MTNQDDRDRADRAIALMREAGLDPALGVSVSIVVQTLRYWAEGQLNDVEFMRAMRNLAIINPALALS
ncbi:MAG: hypothetical protein KME45_03560 [Stenomitos rutilans HA7619-LM2]|jgi:hypothetical protein|nr:hypothetical protein [Stenomitos rutilans HA7619-LM2]MBW4469463.1 hypothetical protein [Stenomitos rutilans HA7619-LM2]